MITIRVEPPEGRSSSFVKPANQFMDPAPHYTSFSKFAPHQHKGWLSGECSIPGQVKPMIY